MLPIEVMNELGASFIHKRIFGAAKGFLGGGFTGAISGFAGGGGGTRARVARRSALRSRGRSRSSRGAVQVVPTPGMLGLAQRAIPFGATGFQVAAPLTGNGCPQGFHPNKSDYFTKAGFVAEGSKCVKNRRRNLSNGRANTKSLRRMAAWSKQEKKRIKTMKEIARGV